MFNFDPAMRIRASILVLALFSCTANVLPQDKSRVRVLPAGASFDETSKWLVDAVPKAADYKTDERSVSIGDIKFEACKLSFATVKQYDMRSYAAMGTTKSSTSVKETSSLDLQAVSPDGIYLIGSLVPQIATVVFSSTKYQPPDSPLGALTAADPGKLAEFELRRSEAENLRRGLISAVRLCQAAR